MDEATAPVLAALLVPAVLAPVVRAVLLATLCGAPAGRAVLAPVAELARRTRGPLRAMGPTASGATALLLLAALARTVVLIVGDIGAVGGLVVIGAAQLAVLVAGRLVGGRRGTGAAALAALLALAAPAVAAGSTRLADIAAAQDLLWIGVQAPVALLIALAAAAPALHGGGATPATARWLALGAGAAVVATLFLGGSRPPGPGTAVAAVVLVVAVVGVETLGPRLARPGRVAWAAAGIAALQLVVVATVTTLGPR